MTAVALKEFSWERMIAAVEDVRERVRRATSALTQAGIAHVVVGGNAVAAWVARVDREAVRNTKDVDLLVRRQDFPRVMAALRAAGFVHQYLGADELFLDGPEGSVRSAIHIMFACEKVHYYDVEPSPDVTECEPGPEFPVATLPALVRMKVHLLDLLQVGLIDETWCDRLPPELAGRLREIMDEEP